MSRFVVDTNVPIVANGRLDPQSRQIPTVDCRTAAITFLVKVIESGRILLDVAGEIQAEYHRHLSPRGQPGVGDRFYLAVLQSAPKHIERIDLPKREDGEYADLPQEVIASSFDPSDRKFAALAKKEQAPVVNAVDTDWLEHRVTLAANDIAVEFVCGCDSSTWFDRS